MTGPVDHPVPASGSGPVSDPVESLEAELAHGDGSRLAHFASGARTGTRIAAGLVTSTGILALVAGVAAWWGSPIALIVILAACVPAIVAPLYVARRAGQLARAAAQPKEVARQVQDLIGRIRNSTELRSLASRIAHRGPGEASGPVSTKRGRIRGAIGIAKLASTVIGQAQPDEERHPLLVPFTPERLGRTWWALGWVFWGWLLAAVVLLLSIATLLADAA